MLALAPEDISIGAVILRFKDGATLRVPIEILVEDRADYYGREENPDGWTKKEAVQDTLELFDDDNEEAYNWMIDEMYFNDYELYATWEGMNQNTDYEAIVNEAEVDFSLNY